MNAKSLPSSTNFRRNLLVVVCVIVANLWLFIQSPFGSLPAFQTGLLLAHVVLAAYWDLTTHRIPNMLTYGILAIALSLQVWLFYFPQHGQLGIGLAESLLGSLICGTATLLLWRMRVLGGGDVKLACGLGALMGTMQAASAILLAHVVAALFIAAWIGIRVAGQINPWFMQLAAIEQLDSRGTPISPMTRIPMAGFYACGVIGWLLWNQAY